MMLQEEGFAIGMTATQAATAINAVNQTTTAGQLVGLIALEGATAVTGAACAYPYAMLVLYYNLPDANKMPAYVGPAGRFFHWIVRLDAGHYFDPLHFTGEGQPFALDPARLDTIEQGVDNRFAVAPRNPKPPEAAMKYKATKLSNTYSRATTASGDANRQGWLDPGDVVNILRTLNGRGQFDVQSVETGVLCGGLWVDMTSLIQLDAASTTTPTPPPAPPLPVTVQRPILIGFNSLGDGAPVKLAASLGSGVSIVLNNQSLASNDLKAQKYTLVRHVDWRPGMSLDQRIGLLEGCNDTRILYTQMNEGDGGYDGSPAGIRARFAEDLEMANYLNAKGCRLVGGHFSTGNPDITNADIRTTLRETYADAYNRNIMDFAQHAYSPSKTHLANYEDTKWHETRAGFYYTDCGFDYKSPARLFYSECGVDEGSVGGFPAHGMGSADVIAWLHTFVSYHKREWSSPISGAKIPYIPLTGACVFVIGINNNWGGYDVSGMIQDIANAGLFKEQ